jgi:hypothetical protein
LGERVSVRLQRTLLNERKENEIGDAGRGIYAFAIVRKGIYIRYVSSSNSVSKRQDLTLRNCVHLFPMWESG